MSTDYTKAARWMKRQQKAYREYVQNEPQMGFPVQSQQKVEAYASGVGNFGDAAVGLEYLAGYEGTQGCLRVLDGDAGGFEQIDRACLYNFWLIRMLVSAYDSSPQPDKQPRIHMETVATCWMHAAALGVSSIRDWLSARITRIVEQEDRSIGGKDMNPLCTLMAHFATGRGADELKRSGWSSIGVYAPVAARKLHPGQYDELADYHTQRVGGADYAEFHFFPYSLVPFELLTIEKFSGVRMESQHPLLTSPLARRREIPEIPVPKLLAAMIDRARPELLL